MCVFAAVRQPSIGFGSNAIKHNRIASGQLRADSQAFYKADNINNMPSGNLAISSMHQWPHPKLLASRVAGRFAAQLLGNHGG